MKFSVLIFSFNLLAVNVLSQQIDTTVAALPDTLTSFAPDTTFAVDTTLQRRYDVDTVVYASASDSLIFFIKNRKMNLYGEGELSYKQTNLKSANIFVDFETSDIEAIGIPSDSLPNSYEETPVLKERGEVYEGVRMKYNFKTQRGFISSAGSESEGAIYTGAKIKKVDRETYFIEDGIYTTCDAGFPHYHFYSPKMKVIHKEQMVAEWIWLNFGGVPFPIPLPFAIFPIESGRRSGLLPPAFGEDGTYGRYFSRFGYFWAISDYVDWNITGDYYTRGSYNLNSRFRYAKRYNFSGSIEGGYSDFKIGEETDIDRQERQDWRIRWNHNQTIDPSLRFDANLEFVSGNYLRRNVTDFNEILRNEIYSNATIFKSWDNGNSLSMSYSRRQTIETGDISEVLPNLSFSIPQSYPFKRKAAVGDPEWYELIGFNYNSQFQNNRNKKAGDLQIRGAIQHNATLNASPKIGYFSISPNVRYQERWYNKRVEKESIISPYTEKDSVITRDIHQINFVRTFSLGVSASTKFYGVLQPNTLGISAIRHTVNPSISYSFQPDFSKPFWGYYDSYKNSAGQEVRYNKYERELFGGIGSGERQDISFSVSNNFEVKTMADPTDTTSKEEKIQLMNINAGLSYNFAADSLNFSDINVSFRTQVGDLLNLFGSSTFSLYDYTSEVNRINKFLINEGKGLARMTNLSLSVSTSISGERLQSKETSQPQQYEEPGEFELNNSDRKIYQGIYSEKDPDFSIPWDLQLSYNYTYNKPTPLQTTTYSNISGSLNFNLTPNWKFSVTGSYDFDRKEFSAPQVRISRDLHCWLMNFTWNPLGTLQGYRFEIRVKAPQLQDLKVTKRDLFYSGK
jgi:lipopolysaccharide assembly outer membrane protein LptD (OstA)